MNYLIMGNSFNLINAEINKIVGDKNRNTYYLDEIPFDEILNDLYYDSMFATDKVVIIKNFNTCATKKENNNSLDALYNYLEQSNDNVTLILISAEKLNKTGLMKKIMEKLEVIETPIFSKPFELVKIIGDLINKDGYGISQGALNSLASKCACNYDIIINEYDKLKIFKGNNRQITDADIEEVISNYNITDIFGFKDAVINKNISLANKMLIDLEASKMEVLPLVIMLAKEYQLLYTIKLMSKENLTNEQIGLDLGVHSYRVKVLRNSSLKYNELELERIILCLCNMNMRMISEDNLGYSELKKIFFYL